MGRVSQLLIRSLQVHVRDMHSLSCACVCQCRVGELAPHTRAHTHTRARFQFSSSESFQAWSGGAEVDWTRCLACNKLTSGHSKEYFGYAIGCSRSKSASLWVEFLTIFGAGNGRIRMHEVCIISACSISFQHYLGG